ncbi:hypothetical protein GCM10007301_43430 [Azorhizobium oxalatiphilum]|uniref:HTH marR-type domain-containing protein n=1 Tax=Azorhizobium oxalatiphilum TaxID=980631 RepID=A0A917FGW6_9HYPH|nr:MarR family transcriptional regulator [Azorhizobium oxalatiphilum]GGF78734.1 hypothetical protein GCM10007301_43430 [Azorhizobium oxalatiphilum]
MAQRPHKARAVTAPAQKTPTEKSPAETARDRMGIRLALAARAWRRRLDASFSALGLTDATWAPLIHLAEHGDGITQKELAARVGLDASTLVRLIDMLETRDLVRRETDLDDRRIRHIHLTPNGHGLLAQMHAARRSLEADLLADLSDQDIATLGGLLTRIEQRLGGAAG